MLKQITILVVTMALAFAAYSIHAQQASEIFIPIGKSPGISESLTIVGKIETVNAQQQLLTLSDTTGTYTVKINADTQIWLDNSKLKKTNQVGSAKDCQPGRTAEVKYTEPERAQTVIAEWIKVEITE